VTRDTLQIPNARTWRDIPQPVVPRAMSREGRWRLTMSGVRSAIVVLVCAALVWGAYLVITSLDHHAGSAAGVANASPLKAPELHSDGVLNNAWLAQALALPSRATLTQLDLVALRARLLADPQIVNATLTRNFPDRLIVQVTERAPVARVMTQAMGLQRMLLVSRDGVIYEGKCYDQAMLATLPWLDGVEIAPQGAGFTPIEGMPLAAELLAKARLEAEHLYSTWGVISLARLSADHQLVVRTKDNACVITFSTRDDYFRQLAKLNYIWDQLTKIPNARATVDLSLGGDVPVMVQSTPATEGEAPAAAPAPAVRPLPIDSRAMSATYTTSDRNLFFPPQPNKKNREL
jgi:cell division septal protein FtsQ